MVGRFWNCKKRHSKKVAKWCLYLKGLCVRGSWRPNRTNHIDPPTLMAISVSFPFSWATQTGALEPSLSGTCSSIQHLLTDSSGLQTAQLGAWGLSLLGAGFLYRILSPTVWISCALIYIIVQHPLLLVGDTIALIQPIHGQGYNSDIRRPDAPFIYKGAFPILTARPGRRSIKLWRST